MKIWNRYFYGNVAAIRPYLLIKVVLIFLAMDRWIAMSRFGSIYGAAGFNVAHFPWLDALQPLPTADYHVAFLLLTGLLSVVFAFSGGGRIALFSLFLLYTYCWSMSRLGTEWRNSRSLSASSPSMRGSVLMKLTTPRRASGSSGP